MGSNPCYNLGFSSMELDVNSVLYLMLKNDFPPRLAGFVPANIHFSLNVKLPVSGIHSQGLELNGWVRRDGCEHVNRSETAERSGDYYAVNSPFPQFHMNNLRTARLR